MEQIFGTINNTNEECTVVKAPRTGNDLYKVNFTSEADMDLIVCGMNEASKQWAELTFKSRVKFLHKYYQLLQENRQNLIELIVLENGKLENEANAEVEKALELTEFAISIPTLINGKTQEVSRGVEVKEVNEPVGNVLLITPFNFPLMIPHWNLLNVLVTGNGAIIKPSTQTPKTIQLVVSLLIEAGVPEGLVNIAYGEQKVVEYLVAKDEINAVTFVGSTPVAKIVHEMAASNGKRALCLGGAKNHTIICDDVNPREIAGEIVESAFGMCGQRCMATSVLSIIGEGNPILDYVLEEIQKVECFSPMVTSEARDKLVNYINNADCKIVTNGLVDDTNTVVQSNAVRPTIIEFSNPTNLKDEEMFGPLLEVVRFDSIDEAIKFQNQSQYANGSTIYTSNGYNASLACKLTAGMIGVNVGVPVPREPYGFAGLKNSKFGYGEISGLNSLEFLMNKKRITQKWDYKNKTDWTN